MPNAKDANVNERNPQRFLMLGPGGSGKTTLFSSLPGRKFMYIFDPNALSSLEGADVDYEEFLVDFEDIDFAVKTLKADKGDNTKRNIQPKTYMKWEKHFDDHFSKGFFDTYDYVGFDSATILLGIIMDRVLFLNGRTGKQPEQADWAAQVNTFGNIFRVMASRPFGLYCTGHIDLQKDERSGRTYNRPLLTGVLRVRIPLLFNNVLICHAFGDEDGMNYQVQTRPDKEYPNVRTALRGLEMYEDVTIQDFSNPSATGLGELLMKAGKGPAKPALIAPKRKGK